VGWGEKALLTEVPGVGVPAAPESDTRHGMSDGMSDGMSHGMSDGMSHALQPPNQTQRQIPSTHQRPISTCATRIAHGAARPGQAAYV